MPNPKPKYTVPTPAPKQGTGLGAQLAGMLKQHGPAWAPYAPLILKWASVYKMDPLELAAVLLIENPSAQADARSSAGAVGPAQILDKSINPNTNPNAVWDGPAVLSDAWKQNFNNAVKYAAWRIAGHINQYGTIDAAYSQGYNPGYTGKLPTTYLPKGYIPTSGPGTTPTPAETAGPSVAGTAARKALSTTEWAVLQPNGKVKFASTRDVYDPSTGQVLPQAPKGTLTQYGQPLSSAAFLQQYASISDQYLSYTGKRPSLGQAAQVIKNGTSQFELQQQLSESKGFVGSPVWKQNAPSYIAVWQSVYGPNSKPDQKAIASAIANNVGSTGFQEQLRQRPDYTKSEEYQSTYTALANVFGQIYGTPSASTSTVSAPPVSAPPAASAAAPTYNPAGGGLDLTPTGKPATATTPVATTTPPPGDEATIDAAVKNGWDANTFARYLRNQPQWKSSAEAQSLYYGLATRLGLISGPQTVLGSAAPSAPVAPPAP